MKIPFEKLITDYNRKHPNAKLNKRKLAIAMYDAGLYDTIQVGQNTIQRQENGQAKSISFVMLQWLALYFNVNGTELIEFDEPTISEVAPHIRDDAPGLKNMEP